MQTASLFGPEAWEEYKVEPFDYWRLYRVTVDQGEVIFTVEPDADAHNPYHPASLSEIVEATQALDLGYVESITFGGTYCEAD